MLDRDPLGDHRDVLLADRLAEALARDGWSVERQRLVDGRWLARVACPSPGFAVEAGGTSRVSAISAAHVEAVRRLSPAARPEFVASIDPYHRGVRRC